MADDLKPQTLAVPKVAALRDEALGAGAEHRIQMERTASQDIREQQEDLKEAAEHSLTVIIELDLEGKIRHISESWEEIIGTDPKEVLGKPMDSLLLGNNALFAGAQELIKKDDTRSQIIRFVMNLGPKSHLRRRLSRPLDLEGEVAEVDEQTLQSPQEEEEQTINLEAQGIMCYDRSTGEESHVSATFMHFPWVKLIGADYVDDPAFGRARSDD